ncbi:hypothetical protein KEM48_005697 [Puccinia striiformis f. sp. tritici PST-130]|nr:hypothetical protein KEM48_005697 [Puccinia striiformis f. sp. tritici PST-130]
MMVIPAEPATNTLIGVGISVAGNLLISIALNLQKLAHLRLENRPPISPSHPKRASESTPLIDHHPQDSRDLESDSATQPSDRSSSSSSHSQSYQPNDLAYLSSPLWWMGFILMSTGELGNFVSYGFAPASVVAPLGTVALVGNCVVAPIVLGEKFKKRDWLGIGLTIIGTITIVLSSPRNSESLSPDQLSLAIQQVGFIVYASLCALTILLLMCLSSTQWANRFIGIDVGLCAISGGFTVLSTKAFSSLLNVLFLDCFHSYHLGHVGGDAFDCDIANYFLNRALQRFDSKQVVPVQFVLFTIMAVIGSTILYGDFRDFGSAQVGNFYLRLAKKLRSTCRNTTLTPVPEESIESSSITDMVIQPPDTNRSFAMGIQGATTASIHLSHKLASPSSWKSLQFSFTSPARRTIRRQRSQPILYPRAFGTPGYYLIASSSTSRSHGTSHGFPGLV